MPEILTAELSDLANINGGKFATNSITEAYTFCKEIAEKHYENFPVGSILVPQKIRKHFYAIYAFARIADDIGDELNKITNQKNTLATLNKYKNCLNIIYATTNKNIELQNPIFLALQDTIKKFNIPISPFLRLISAFESDILFNEFENFDELLAYCNNSANPIGELLLQLFDEYNNSNLYYSNNICSALQLINFWQDLSLDLAQNRCYIPQEILNINNLNNIEEKTQLVEILTSYTENIMNSGENLLRNIHNFRFKLELAAIISGGSLLLNKTKKLGANIFNERPTLNKKDAVVLFYKTIKLLLKY